MSDWKKVFNNNVSLYVQIIKKYLLNNGWASICLNDYIKIMPTFQVKDAVFSKDYKKEGAYPIVSQSKDLISGYYDDKLLLNQISNPIIIFGDHTQVVKYIDFDFILGADGTKILTVSEDYNPKFFYYLIKSINLHSNKYARHYSKLRKEFILFHKESLQIQLSIVSFLDSLENNCISKKYFFDEKTESEIISLQKDFYSISSIEIEIEKQKSYTKQLRQNILQEAIEGKLTADWRKQHPVQKGNPDYDAEALLGSLQQKKESLKKDPSVKREKIRTPVSDTEKEFSIPNNWIWIRMGELCYPITKGTTPDVHEIKADGEIPYLKMFNIVNQKLDFDYRPQYISKKVHDEKLTRSKVYPNDVIMNIVGPPMGKIAIVTDEFPEWNLNQAMAIFRGYDISINPYIYVFLNSMIWFKYVHTLGVVGQENMSLEQCKDIAVALPPLAEQTEIVRVVEAQLAKVDQLEKQITERETMTKQLIQSIMKDAFREE